MTAGIDPRSIQSFAAWLNTTARRMESAAIVQADTEIEALMQESVLLVPVWSGTLQASVFQVKESTATGTTIRFGYGGPNVQFNPNSKKWSNEYMLSVHEDLNAVHPTGQAKFFTQPLDAREDLILSNIYKAMLGAI